MSVKQILAKYYEGESGNAKPTGVIAGTTFRETDTNKMWITYDGDNWIVADKRVRLVNEEGDFIDLPNELIHHLVDGNLTENGIQWSDEVVTVDADTDYTVLEKTLDFGLVEDIAELILGLTLAIKAGNATADVKYKWQARNKGGTWVDLCDYFTKANINTTYKEYTVSGYKFPVTNLDAYPIDIKLVIQSNEATPGVATSKVKNSSQIKVVLK